MGTNFSQQTMQTSITEHEYRVEALQKRIKELENENDRLSVSFWSYMKDNGNI
jgi:predicted nuclease with TOPRIM domain